MKKLLIFSHASVLEVNRDVFYELSRQHQAEVRIACPEFWRGDLIRDLNCQTNTKFPAVTVVPLPTLLAGNGSLFFYRTRLRQAFKDWQPDFVFVDEEPWSLACFQIYNAFPKAELV